MRREPRPIDISEIRSVPQLLRIVEEVRKSEEARIITRDGEDLAVLGPVKAARRRAPRRPTQDDYEAFLASAGSWSDVDVEQFKRDNAESRRISTRPPVEL